MRIGLRIDVDTFRGTQRGVPNLCRLLAAHSIRATFFFCVGPDNMGRHIWRLLRPAFLRKMLRTGAPALYGWEILFRGTMWPGPLIGAKFPHVIREVADAGHEVGLHAWDHHGWQACSDRMNQMTTRRELERGVDALTRIIGRPPTCSAAPAWRCTDLALEEKERMPFIYNSDCRGYSIFRPVLQGRKLTQPQIPTTLPTYDEVVGRNRMLARDYNQHLLALLNPRQLNVLTIHAEVEGIGCSAMFDDFLRLASARGAEFAPLGSLLTDPHRIPAGTITRGTVTGREGWVSCQAM